MIIVNYFNRFNRSICGHKCVRNR